MNVSPSRILDGIRILLVEDTPDQQRLLTKQLSYAGADVTLECNGSAAVAAVRRTSRPFDVVVMDLLMPVLDGVSATRELRSLGFTLPVLAVSARTDEPVHRECLTAGCNAFLVKPIPTSDLVETILSLVSELSAK